MGVSASSVGPTVPLKSVKQCLRIGTRLAPLHKAAAQRFVGQPDVFLNREVGNEAEFLVDGGEAEGARRVGRAETDPLAVEQKLTRIGRDNARKNLAERALAAAVGPHKGDHVA